MSYEELLAEYERLRAREADLQAQTAQWQEHAAELQAQNIQLKQQLSEAQEQIAALKRQLFGSKADRLTEAQQKQLDELQRDLETAAKRPEALSCEILTDQEPAPEKRRLRRPRQPLPVHLEEETVELEPELLPCPGCGKLPVRIGEETTEEIDFIPAQLIRRKIVRPKYACRCGEAGVSMAPLPPRLIPQSRLGLGLAVHITLARFDDHLPFYRLEQQFRERHGVILPRQQMVQWTVHIATWLRPLYDALWRSMLDSGYLQVDETPVRVLDPEVQRKAARGYLWFYAVPGGDVLLVFDSSRGLDPVRERLKDFHGTIQTDAYEVYESLCRKESHVKRIGCLAHARRRFYEALSEEPDLALWFISRLRRLYEIEGELRDLGVPERYTRRLQEVPPIWAELKAKAEEIRPALLPKSILGKAVGYFLNEYDALIGYLLDGRFEIDNNLVENAIRPTAVGKRRWLFIGHPDAGWRSAVIYSILISCRRRGLNPQEYLTDVLARLPTAKITQLESLLPGNWKPQGINSG